LNRQGSRRTRKLHILKRWVYIYIEDLQITEISNAVLTLYTKDPKTDERKAIKSFSTVDDARPRGTATCPVAGDNATWGEAGVRRRTEAEDPPEWHAGLEEEKAQAPMVPERGVASRLAMDNSGMNSPLLMNSARDCCSFTILPRDSRSQHHLPSTAPTTTETRRNTTIWISTELIEAVDARSKPLLHPPPRRTSKETRRPSRAAARKRP
jgi:hypothetical protein